MKVGFIGTGDMGNPMAINVVKAGYETIVNTRRQFRAQNILDAGAGWAESARALGEQCEVVFTALPGPKQFEEVLTDPENGLLAGLKPGSAIFDTTTNSPFVVRKVAELCQSKGVHLLDAPISGGSVGAAAGTLTFMVGGDKAVFEKYLPVLESMGKNLFYLGEVGTGCMAKLVTQYVGYCNLITAAEGMLTAAKAGLDLGTMYKIMPVSAGSFRSFEGFFKMILQRDFGTEETGGVDMIAKDLMLGNELAEAVGAPRRMGAWAYELFHQAQEQGMGDYSLTAIARILEGEAGVELKADLSQS